MQGCDYSPLVFVVDDDFSTVRAVEGFLQRAGFRTSSAENVAGGMQGIRDLHPDLILLDVNLADGSGFDVCRALQSDAAGLTTPILFISANGDTLTKVQGFESGGVDYITKPIAGAEVIARVRICGSSVLMSGWPNFRPSGYSAWLMLNKP